MAHAITGLSSLVRSIDGRISEKLSDVLKLSEGGTSGNFDISIIWEEMKEEK